MRKIIGMLMIIAIFAAVNAADDTKQNKDNTGAPKAAVQGKGHVCYNSIAFQAEALAKQGKDAEAIKMYEDAKANPDYEHHYQYLFPSLVKLYEKTKQYDKSIALWNDGHKKNMTFGLDPAKAEYKPYLTLKGFKEAVKKDQELVKAKAVPNLKSEDCEGHENVKAEPKKISNEKEKSK
ncbi:MAG TPA: hypothetical protein PLK90_00705 [Clostridiales bacterium]|jgi:hypothetical protein|nr:hypothetical protein [Clostridiales bacterium]HQP68897.1 hypothetical protein [Clostridiales bacterium]